MDKCGTYAGYNQHNKDGTPVCDECRAAATAYMADWRRRTGRITHELVPVTSS